MELRHFMLDKFIQVKGILEKNMMENRMMELRVNTKELFDILIYMNIICMNIGPPWVISQRYSKNVSIFIPNDSDSLFLKNQLL